jgi:hypothetical protein
MSIKIIFAAATLALAIASLSGQGQALAGSDCNGTVRHFVNGTWQCYFLPTVENGRVSGLQEKVNVWTPYRDRPPHGAVVGGPVVRPAACHYLPTVVNGRVTGTHEVCG